MSLPRAIPLPDRWSLHSYYSLCPYAPDGSDRLLLAGADLSTQTGEIIILGPDRTVEQRFSAGPVSEAFWHTGYWQTWSPDARSFYFQGGSLDRPFIRHRDLATGKEVQIEGDMEGAPPFGEPILSGLLGMLYAAGYGDGRYKPERAPVPFQARDRHGLFAYRLPSFDAAPSTLDVGRSTLDVGRSGNLRFSVADILARHPQRDRILAADREIAARLGSGEGLTLMTYCVRWNRAGTRGLFFFGNHCVVKERGEPKITSVFTFDRGLNELHLAVDLSFGRRGVHWSWQADNEHLIGYGPDPDDASRQCLAEVRFDGTGYRKLSDHASGGHPSTNPLDPNLIVTDEGTPTGGAVVFIDRRDGRTVARHELPKFIGDSEPPGRNPLRICHHPVFNRRGDRVLCNMLPGPHAVLAEITPPRLPA